MMENKICCTCGESLPATKEFFHVRNTSPDGLRCDCKKCRKEKIPKRDRETKRCFYCDIIKPNTTEYFYSQSKGGLRSQCIECHSKYQKEQKLLSKYNLTLEQYNNKCEEQDFKCQICGKKKKLYVDHNHSTNEVRGLLCDLCNRGIGMLQEDPQILINAINYLKKYNE